MSLPPEWICENCNLFCVFTGEDYIQAISVGSSESVETISIEAGERSCSAKNTAWADAPCTTGEFVPRETAKPIL